MKRRCGLFLFLISAGALVGCAHPGLSEHTDSTPSPTEPPAATQASVARPMMLPPQIVPPPATLTAASASGPTVQMQTKLEDYLQFDAEDKEVSITNGTTEAHFTFNVTNISSAPVTIEYVKGSCQCTVAQLPTTPWKLAPKEGGQFSAVMQMAGTPPGGIKFKTLTVGTDNGIKELNVRTTVLPEPADPAMVRTSNVKMATADRQAVFKGNCIECHVTPAKDAAGHDKIGQDLYAAVCGVCHEAQHRASFVPNLHQLKEPTSTDFWRNWIMHGKPGTLMPAFAKVEGGILSDEQINSLVLFLNTSIPPQPVGKLSPPGSLQVIQ